MKVLFLSNLGSPTVINQIFETTKRNPGFAIQKFNRLLVKGLAENKVEVDAVSTLPFKFDNSKSVSWKPENDQYKGVRFHYIRLFRNLRIKRCFVFLYSFFYTLFWSVANRQDKYVICDVLKQSITLGGYYACKLFGIKCIALVTDMPGALSFQDELAEPKIPDYLKRFSGFIFLSEMANDIINTLHKPYVTFDGFVDEDSCSTQTKSLSEAYIMFAGGIFPNQGILKALKAFMNIDSKVCFDVYGEGTDVAEIQKLSDVDHRIRYKGVVSNSEIVQAETNALLLVNPMPSDTTFAKFSFPSKNMEYMMSGTPLLTTRVISIPKEDYPYLFFFDDESIEGMTTTFREILSMNQLELKCKGENARAYVLQNKIPKVQSLKIIQLLNRL